MKPTVKKFRIRRTDVAHSLARQRAAGSKGSAQSSAPSGAEKAEYAPSAIAGHDPKQERPISAPDVEARLVSEIERHFDRHDAPRELYTHFSLSPPDGRAAMSGE